MDINVSTLHGVDIEECWRTARRLARLTEGKGDFKSNVSDGLKKTLIALGHSPIRSMWFEIEMKGIPTCIAQQFSRHQVSGIHGDFFMHENVQPADKEHFVTTQRTDRNGIERGSQNAPVDYTLLANVTGLIEMSKKRLCHAAQPEAIKIWREVVVGVRKVCPEVASAMKPMCAAYGRCIETRVPNCSIRAAFNKVKYECTSDFKDNTPST